MDILNIMIITAWMAMACAVSALVPYDRVYFMNGRTNPNRLGVAAL